MLPAKDGSWKKTSFSVGEKRNKKIKLLNHDQQTWPNMPAYSTSIYLYTVYVFMNIYVCVH